MKAAIVGLVKGYKKLRNYTSLIRRNYLIKKNVDKSEKYDKIIFTEGNIEDKHKKVIGSRLDKVTFVDVSGDFEKKEEVKPEWRTKLGYKNMCRFNSVKIWKYVKEYKYIMRLDDDSFVMNGNFVSSTRNNKVYKDVFKFMEEEGATFMYVRDKWDSHRKTESTLPENTKNFIRNRGLHTKCGNRDISSQNFYNNIYATKVSFWRRKKVKEYLSHVDKSMGIYKHRWGDSTVMALAIKMFCDRDKVVKADRVKYRHGSHGWSNYNENDTVASLKSNYWRNLCRLYEIVA